MTDTSKCFSLIRGRMMRVTKLDGCGAPDLGPKNAVVSNGFISVALAAQTDEGTAISVTNAAGDVCISDEPAPQFTGYDVTVEFCGVNPELVGLMTGQPLVLNDDGSLAVGFKMNSKIDADASGFALEVWSNVPSAQCSGGVVSYGYFLIPFLKGGIIGDFTIQNDAVNFTLTGAKSKDGNAWGVGPWNVQETMPSGVAGPLVDPLDPYDHLTVFVTTIAPPSVTNCGSVQLGVPATSAVAGIPGSYLPANSYGRANFAAMTGLTASPTTNWTAGQYVVLEDGSKAYWNGTAWLAGVHP